MSSSGSAFFFFIVEAGARRVRQTLKAKEDSVFTRDAAQVQHVAALNESSKQQKQKKKKKTSVLCTTRVTRLSARFFFPATQKEKRKEWKVITAAPRLIGRQGLVFFFFLVRHFPQKRRAVTVEILGLHCKATEAKTGRRRLPLSAHTNVHSVIDPTEHQKERRVHEESPLLSSELACSTGAA